MGIIEITYCFNLDNNKKESFELRLDANTLELIVEADERPEPEWIALENNQCPNCPYKKETQPHCPVAKNLVNIVDRFGDICSYEEIGLEVITDERCVTQTTTAQRAISSLLGLIFATSGCTYTAYMKPMARFHLPLASQEETTFRAAGMYLLAQYFQRKIGEGGELSMDGLKKIYQDLHVVNMAISTRIRSVISAESSVNALVILDARANMIPFVVEDYLDEIQALFEAYKSDHV